VIKGFLLNQLLLKVCNLPRKLPLYILIFLSFTDNNNTIKVNAPSYALFSELKRFLLFPSLYKAQQELHIIL
jgi:hypothetical protein